ncbi:hypothetical protein [Hyperthermus butylicus]|uniref:Uncharacterized protein n=1 Tax=Hyperthermus butylicus (strain DSM 5456 / JCM 9403 / PLM1-5) TaxID=415426 RepID=A2BKQ2_HYPBU|nr:hypothetical protein [Hyperthermus butylicus]ABM80563.1 hypothetical protein Hbut_0708 [Hyperthermus butylicus DSM 5456]
MFYTPLLYVVDAKTLDVEIGVRIAPPAEIDELRSRGLLHGGGGGGCRCGDRLGLYCWWGGRLDNSTPFILYWVYCFPSVYSFLLNITLRGNVLYVALEEYNLTSSIPVERVARTFTIDDEAASAIAYMFRVESEEIVDLRSPDVRVDGGKVVV